MTKFVLRKGDSFVWLDEQSGGYPIVNSMEQTIQYLTAGSRHVKLGVWDSHEAARSYRDMRGSGLTHFEIHELHLTLQTLPARDRFADARFEIKHKIGGGDWFEVEQQDYLIVQTAGQYKKDVEPEDFENVIAFGRVSI